MSNMDLLFLSNEKELQVGKETIYYKPFHTLDDKPVLVKFFPTKVEKFMHVIFKSKKMGVLMGMAGFDGCERECKNQIEAPHPDTICLTDYTV